MALVVLSVVEQRLDAVRAVLAGAGVSEVAARAGVHRSTLHRWVARYLAGISEASPAMWRGTAVEAGLAALWRGGSIAHARTAACNTFELNALGEVTDEIDAEPADG